MKRDKMLKVIESALGINPWDKPIDLLVDNILASMEQAGMKPPSTDDDRRQVLMHIYMDPDFNIWDEDFDKNEQAGKAYKKRMAKNDY